MPINGCGIKTSAIFYCIANKADINTDGGEIIDYLKQNLEKSLWNQAQEYDLFVNEMNIESLCKTVGHFLPVWIPLYDSKLQPTGVMSSST